MKFTKNTGNSLRMNSTEHIGNQKNWELIRL